DRVVDDVTNSAKAGLGGVLGDREVRVLGAGCGHVVASLGRAASSEEGRVGNVEGAGVEVRLDERVAGGTGDRSPGRQVVDWVLRRAGVAGRMRVTNVDVV